MTETFLDGRVTMYIGDVREKLRAMPSDHFDCVVTSPPYWGLRDYGVDGQIGLEPTLGEHLAVMVEVFEEVRRVLKPTGTLWLNYGDCYATAPNGRSAADTKAVGNDDRTFRDKPFSTIGPIQARSNGGEGQHHDRRGALYDPNHRASTSKQRNRTNGTAAQGGRIVAGGYLKSKDLCMIPNRLAIALQDAGWWVRSEIIWHKPNPMPESIRDRPTTSHEKIWLCTKSERYWYDADAIKEPVSSATHARLSQDLMNQIGSARANGGSRSERPMKAVGCGPKTQISGTGIKNNESFSAAVALPVSDRNARNVWTIGTAAFSEAHFATFPPEIPERCIKAGCPAGGLVLDPFGGSGTTAMVAASLGRTATLIELNPEYATLARARIEAAFMGKEEGQRHMVKQVGKLDLDAGPLFAGAAE